jgi:hypothetical protein
LTFLYDEASLLITKIGIANGQSLNSTKFVS